MIQQLWWVPLLSALIGGALAIGGNLAIEARRAKVERRNLALALKGELTAIIRIVSARKYVKHLEEVVALLDVGNSVEMPPLHISRNYFRIYEENASKIGVLPPDIAEKIITTYTYANSFIEDATMTRDPELLPYMAPSLKETCEILKLTLAEAQSTVSLIDTKFREC